MQPYARKLGIIFGVMMILLSVTITLETLLRKFFSYSLGGVDELSGYAVAIAAPQAFTVALAENAHIRINQVTMLLPKKLQALLNVLAMVSIALLACYFFYFSVTTVVDTYAYKSIAQTPWATPLIYPQSVWIVAMATFPIASVLVAIKVLYLLFAGQWTSLNQYGPASADVELKAELDDLKKREGYAK